MVHRNKVGVWFIGKKTKCKDIRRLELNLLIFIFRASSHGYSAASFHRHCDGVSPTYVIALVSYAYLKLLRSTKIINKVAQQFYYREHVEKFAVDLVTRHGVKLMPKDITFLQKKRFFSL